MFSGDSHFFRDAWELTKPYWSSEERWRALGFLLGIVTLNIFQVYLLLWLNEWRGLFFNALQDYNEHVFFHQLLRFCIWAVIYIANAFLVFYWMQLLQIRWRRWLTNRYLGNWFDHAAYYRLQIQGLETDNPDQRIADDLRLFTQQVPSLSIGLFNAVITFASFISVLWILSGPITVPLGSFGAVTIPGYAAIGAIIYAGIGTWATVKVGRPLIGLTYNQQRFEANFRYSLMRVRENSESIAFYNGEGRENGVLQSRFRNIYGNFIALLMRQIKLTALNSGYSQIAIIVPYLVAAPKYFGKQIQFGGVQQIATAFDQVQTSLSFIVNSYGDIAELQAIMVRLNQFRHHTKAIQDEQSPITRVATNKGGLTVSDLDLDLPNGSALQRDIRLEVPEGSRLLIMGPTGAGKSTLLRAISGLWPFGRGRISSSALRPLFLPQKPYIPLGTLRDAVMYPSTSSDGSDERVSEALGTVGLQYLSHELNLEDNWAQRLSIGEQQRLAFARILVYQPDMIYLDEATSALDEASEANLYKIIAALPNRPTIISIGHRSTLKRFHDTLFVLEPIALHQPA
jgi:putative ATP-binding cassette transporter